MMICIWRSPHMFGCHSVLILKHLNIPLMNTPDEDDTKAYHIMSHRAHPCLRVVYSQLHCAASWRHPEGLQPADDRFSWDPPGEMTRKRSKSGNRRMTIFIFFPINSSFYKDMKWFHPLCVKRCRIYTNLSIYTHWIPEHCNKTAFFSQKQNSTNKRE